MRDCVENHNVANDQHASIAESVLPDGRRMCYRPISPDDAERLQEFHLRLSRETTRLRFFSPMPRLTDKLAAHFVGVDFTDRCALVAYLPGDDDLRGVGRYEREGAHSAEVAFVVEDEFQGMGIGGTLLRQLAEHGRTRGIDRFTAMTLAENRGMLTVFRESGFPTDVAFDGETAFVKMDIRDTQKARRKRRTLLPS